MSPQVATLHLDLPWDVRVDFSWDELWEYVPFVCREWALWLVFDGISAFKSSGLQLRKLTSISAFSKPPMQYSPICQHLLFVAAAVVSKFSLFVFAFNLC